MKAPFYALFPLLLLFLLARPARATHIVGGEMDLQYLTGNEYRLTLTLYFDAINGNSGALDSDVTVGIFEKGTNRRVRNLTMPLGGNTFVPYTNVACAVGFLSTRRLVYSSIIPMPAADFSNASGYYAVVERCCRNNVISNIFNPGGAGQTFYLEFPAVVRNGLAFRNSSPRIFPPLSDYACRNELFYFDFGGQDIDGDSLVYDMVTPLNGYASSGNARPTNPSPQPYPLVQWTDSLSETRQMPGKPTLAIDRQTGRLTVRPTKLGLFVFGVRCSEFRKGLKIGEVRRDFQLLVINCPRNETPKMVVMPPGSGKAAYVPGRDTLHLQPSPADRCLRLQFTDPDPASALQLEVRAVNFPAAQLPAATISSGTVRSPGMPDTITSTLCFPDCFDTQGKVYLLDVIVADNGCSLPRRDTVRVAFTAKGPPNSPPQVALISPPTTFPISAQIGTLVQQDVEAFDPEGDPLTLELTGKGFSPAAVGAQLQILSTANGRTQARLSWRVACPHVDRQLYEFQIRAKDAPCNREQASPILTVPVQVQYLNRPPVLTSPDLPADSMGLPPVIRIALGGSYQARFDCTDLDLDDLVLSAAAADGSDLAALGMSMQANNGKGRADGLFRWQTNCDAASRGTVDVVFTLQETTCKAEPQRRLVRFVVQRQPAPAFLPPNVFTPNGDNLNNYFELEKNLPPDFCDERFASVEIFSRWGNKIFRSSDRKFRWDGAGAVPGVYYYYIKFTNGPTYKGTVTVLP